MGGSDTSSLDYLTKAALHHSDLDQGNDHDLDDEQTPEGECESPELHAAVDGRPDAPVEVVKKKVKLSDWFVKGYK